MIKTQEEELLAMKFKEMQGMIMDMEQRFDQKDQEVKKLAQLNHQNEGYVENLTREKNMLIE